MHFEVPSLVSRCARGLLGLETDVLRSSRRVSVAKDLGGCSMSTVLGDPVKIQPRGRA